MASGYSQFFTALTMAPGGSGGGAGRAVLAAESAVGPGDDREGIFSVNLPFPAPEFRVPVTRNGNITNFHVSVSANTLTVASTCTVLINGVATALVLTYLAAVTGFSTIGGPVAIVSGDLISVRMTAPAGLGSASFSAAIILTQS